MFLCPSVCSTYVLGYTWVPAGIRLPGSLCAGEENVSDLRSIPRIIRCNLQRPSFLALKLGHHNIPQAKVAETLSHTFSLNPLKDYKDEEMLGCVLGGFCAVTFHPLPPQDHVTDEVG